MVFGLKRLSSSLFTSEEFSKDRAFNQERERFLPRQFAGVEPRATHTSAPRSQDKRLCCVLSHAQVLRL